MSINVGQLFVKHDNLKLLLRIAAEYVRIWQKGVFSRLSNLEKEEQGSENFLTRRSRRLTLLPPRDGWSMIIEQVRFLADGELAKHISESLGCPVIWAEMQGGALGWACFELENGQLVRGKLEPAAGREERLVAAANEAKAISLSEAESSDMPHYPVDPEMDAWNHLCSLGLPREYIFVYPGDVLRLGSGGEMEAGFVTLKDSYYGGRMTAALGPARFLPRPDGLPYRPDLVARSDGQPTAVHEVRLLHGRPTRPALDRVFDAEVNWRRRAFQVMSATLPGNIPQVKFRYKDPADPDRDIDEMIDRRRETCTSQFLTLTSGAEVLARKGFAARAAEVINGEDKAQEAEPAEDGNITVKTGEERSTLDLSRAYRRYVSEPPALEAAAVDALEAFRVRRSLVGELGPGDKDRLSLVVRPAAAQLPDGVNLPLGAGLVAVLAVERDGLLVELPRGALESLGLDENASVEAARQNLEKLGASAQPTTGVGSFSRLETDPPLPASSLMAWPGLAKRLEGIAGGEVAVAVPAANVLLYAPVELARAEDLRAAIIEEFDTSLEPLSEAVCKLTESGIVPA
jgi:hypothetical protein